MKFKFTIFLVSVAFTTITCVNQLALLFPQSITIIDSNENTFIVNGQKFNIEVCPNFDGLSLNLNGNGQSIHLDSLDFVANILPHQTIKSISIINAPASDIRQNEIINTPIIVTDSPDSIIRNNQISDITDPSYTYGIMVNNSPNTQIYDNYIFNVKSTSNSVSGIHLVDSQNTLIKNNTIEQIASTTTSFFDARDTYGIRIKSSPDVKILDTQIENLDSNGKNYGIYVESSPNIIINDSSIDDVTSKASQGIYIVDSQTAIVKNNTITNLNSTTLASFGISLQDSNHSSVILNNISVIDATSSLNGVHLDQSGNSVLGNNTIQSLSSTSSIYPLSGICLEASEFTTIEWNKILNLNSTNSEAIGIFADKSKNLIARNNTITNVTPSVGLSIFECNNTILSWNTLTNVSNSFYIDETSSNVQYSQNIVDGQTVALQSFLRPADLIIEEGSVGNAISWLASDPQARNYSIYKEETKVNNGTWINATPVIYPVSSNLTIGVHSYQIVLTEKSGYNITDVVKVTVIESEMPQLIESPDDLRYRVGALNNELSWTLTDSYPSRYTIYQNDTELVSNAAWKSADPIIIGVSGLPLGVYNYTLVADDTSGNTVKDLVFVFVLQATDVFLETEMPSPMQYKYETTGNVLNWTVNSPESGTYSIYQIIGSIKSKITSGAFDPGESIFYPIDGLSLGTYHFSIEVNSEGNLAEDIVIVNVVAQPTIPGGYETLNVTIPRYTTPPYAIRPAGDPLPTYITGAVILFSACVVAYWFVTRRLMVPTSVKEEKKSLRKARKVKDTQAEGVNLGEVGRAYFKAGNYTKAMKYHKEALSIFKKSGDKKAQLRELERLGDAYLAKGVEEKHD